MKTGKIAFVAMLLVCGSVAKADTVSWQGGGANGISRTYDDLAKAVAGADNAAVASAQSVPAGISPVGAAPSADPADTVVHDLTNNTGSAWVGYLAAITLYSIDPLTSESLSAAQVTLPGNWSANIDQQFVQVTPDSGGPFAGEYKYVGHITYSDGTPVASGSQLDLTYTETFSGSMYYTQVEALSPVYAVPEPGTAALLAALAVAGLFFGWRKRA